MNEVTNLRDLGLGSQKPKLTAKGNVLLLVKNISRVSFEASNKGDKEQLLEEYNETEGDLLFLIWQGEWSSHPFLVEKEDVSKFY